MNRATIPEPGKETVRLSGVNATLLGDVWNNFNSTEILLHRLDVMKPDVILVAGMHPWSHRKYMPNAWSEPAAAIPEDEDLFVRAKFTQFFKKVLRDQPLYYSDNFGIFYLADSRTRTCLPDSNLSACYCACEDERAKLIAAGPPPLLAQELLATQFSLEQLRDMYIKTLDEVKQRSKALSAQVPEYEFELYDRVTGIAKELYGKELLTHRTLYTAGVLHKACQAFKNPILVIDDQILSSTLQTCQASVLPRYSDLYKPLNYEGSLESLLEKLAILTFLDNDDFHKHCKVGAAPLKLMFQGQFAQCPAEQVAQGFKFFYEQYQKLFYDVFVAELERIPTEYTEGRSLPKLSKSLETIEARESSLLSHVMHKQIEGETIAEVLIRQMERNIVSKLAAGISQTQEILALQEAGKGEVSAIHQEVLRRLIFEANEQLQLTKLPEDFKQYKKFMQWGVSANELKQFLHKDFCATVIFDPKMNPEQPAGFFFDPANPPKELSASDQRHLTLILGKDEESIKFEGKSLEELKAMGAEEVGVIDGEVTRSGLKVDKSREKKRELAETLMKAGLMTPPQ